MSLGIIRIVRLGLKWEMLVCSLNVDSCLTVVNVVLGCLVCLAIYTYIKISDISYSILKVCARLCPATLKIALTPHDDQLVQLDENGPRA